MHDRDHVTLTAKTITQNNSVALLKHDITMQKQSEQHSDAEQRYASARHAVSRHTLCTISCAAVLNLQVSVLRRPGTPDLVQL